MSTRQGWLRRLAISALILTILAIFTNLTLQLFNPTTVVLLLRHAEKASSASDSPLSAVGVDRARELAHVTGQARVQAIYASEYVRTQQTVQPLADQIGLPVTQRDKADVAGLVTDILASHTGQVVLVAGHSDSVPDIIQELSGQTVPAIRENEFDNLYVVFLSRFGGKRVLHLKYGVPCQP
jgi:broad specificity phosphatase PhoE